MCAALLWLLGAAPVAAESGPWPLRAAHGHHHHHHYRGERPAHDEPPPPSTAFDRLRTRTPPGGAPPLLPLQWGTVSPRGWIRDWAVTASEGAASPTNAWFASGNGVPITHEDDEALMHNGTNYPPGAGRANGWKDGQPNSPWTMAEQSAYWMDGMTRLGLVLNSSALKARTAEDITAIVEGGVLNEPTGGPEGWPRSVYSRAMLAYLDATGDTRVLELFAKVWNSSYNMDAEADARSMTQAEAMLEGYAYGGDPVLRDTALRGLSAHQDSFQQAWNSRRCDDYGVNSSCVTDSYELEHGVTWNELAKLWALAAPWSGEEHEAWMNASTGAYELMYERDMMPYGVNSAEEALSGVAPNASTETCDISDFMHSNTWLLRQSGNSTYGDRLERAFHNAAPAAVNREYTEHVYYQSANLREIPKGVDGQGYIEYGDNISRRWDLNGKPSAAASFATPLLSRKSLTGGCSLHRDAHAALLHRQPSPAAPELHPSHVDADEGRRAGGEHVRAELG